AWVFITNNLKLITNNKQLTTNDEKFERLLNKTIKKVGDDIQNFKFNTAISALMILLNAMEKTELSGVSCESFVKLLHPFAPHMAQELWSNLGHDTILDFEKWPEYDEKLVEDEIVKLVIQVSGRVRGTVEISPKASEAEATKLVL